MSTLVICPSRGRPDAARKLIASYLETFRDPGSRLVFLVDMDDPTHRQYPGEVVEVQGGSLGRALRGFTDYGDATSIGVVGDDCRFRTPGWDRLLDGWLAENIGIAWPSDGWEHPWPPEEKAAHWWVSRKVADTFGLAPMTEHLFMDDYWAQLGRSAGRARYFPEVVVEHLHPLAGKGADDATYQRHRRWIAHDRMWYGNWLRRGIARDARKLRDLTREGPFRVFADWHHPALWESLSIVFEDRFGWELYSPAGPEWKAHGWRLAGGTPGWTMDDYLEAPGVEPEYPERQRKTVTVEEFESQPWDVVVASVGSHQQSFADLARRKGARYVHHIGDARRQLRPIPGGVTIASARIKADAIHHQEFDRDLFAYASAADPAVVSSFMLRLASTSGPYQWLSRATPRIRWRAVECEAMRGPGYLAPMSKVADRMRESGWVWHDKRIGDGFGHVLWTAAAMGRPLIGHASHYRGQMGEALWEDGVTCIDLDQHEPDEALRILRSISLRQHEDMGAAIRARFDALVDFDAEAEAIRAVLTAR